MGTQQMHSVPFSLYSVKSGNSWSLFGNAGVLTDGSQFLGTTTNSPLNFVVFNEKSGRIETTSSGNTFFGFRSGKSISSGTMNVGLGTDALKLASNGS